MVPAKFRVWDEVIGQMFYDVGITPDGVPYRVSERQFDYYPPEFLMQYSGLKDKNGKEIYEGDICETVTYSGKPFGTIDVVKFSGGAFKLTDIEDALLPIPLDDSDIQSVEVIGNIYENPELMGRGNNERD